MTFVQDDDVIEAVTAYRADQALDIGILLSHQLHPLGTIRHKYFRLLSHSIHALAGNIGWWSCGKIGAKIASTITTLKTA